MTALKALIARELIRQIRQPTRLVAAIATPAMIWIFLAAGFRGSIDLGDDAPVRAYLIPGIATMTVLFASIFGAISLIQDRQDGFLRAVLVSPAPRWTIAASKIITAGTVATFQGIVVLLILLALGHPITLAGFLLASAVLACVSAALIGFGLMLAWRVNSTQGYHGVMNTVLMPMWLLSGAVFQVDSASPWLAAIARVNPLTWCHDAMRHHLALSDAPNPALAWAITIAFAAAGFAAGAITIARGARNAGG